MIKSDVYIYIWDGIYIYIWDKYIYIWYIYIYRMYVGIRFYGSWFLKCMGIFQFMGIDLKPYVYMGCMWATQMLHVWNIYLHLGNFRGKCRYVFHTWSIWDISVNIYNHVYIYIYVYTYIY